MTQYILAWPAGVPLPDDAVDGNEDDDDSDFVPPPCLTDNRLVSYELVDGSLKKTVTIVEPDEERENRDYVACGDAYRAYNQAKRAARSG